VRVRALVGILGVDGVEEMGNWLEGDREGRSGDRLLHSGR
jgi:hypothetical protein